MASGEFTPFFLLPIFLPFLLCLNQVHEASSSPTLSPPARKFYNAEHRLRNELFGQGSLYDKEARPVYYLNNTVTIQLGMAAISVVEVDTKTQTIQMNAWLRYAWTDIRLQWVPEKYDGINHIRVPWNKIWRPDITLYNSAEPRSMHPAFEDTMAVLQYDGSILFIPHMFLKAFCKMDMGTYPMDTQQCLFKFGSWTFDGYQVDLEFFDKKAQMDLADYVESNQWTVMSAPAKKNIKRYPCCAEPYPDITFTIVLKRSSTYLMYCTPAILVAFLIPLVFLMPYGTGDKTTLAFCILICLLLMIASMEEYLDSTRLPILVGYYLICFIIVGISLIITTLVNSIFAGCTMTPPNAVIKVCSSIGKMMCVSAASSKTDTFALVDEEGNSAPSSSNARAKWLYIATVIDRIMFLVFLVIVAIVTGALLTEK